jgi:hypothetical protein
VDQRRVLGRGRARLEDRVGRVHRGAERDAALGRVVAAIRTSFSDGNLVAPGRDLALVEPGRDQRARRADLHAGPDRLGPEGREQRREHHARLQRAQRGDIEFGHPAHHQQKKLSPGRSRAPPAHWRIATSSRPYRHRSGRATRRPCRSSASPPARHAQRRHAGRAPRDVERDVETSSPGALRAESSSPIMAVLPADRVRCGNGCRTPGSGFPASSAGRFTSRACAGSVMVYRPRFLRHPFASTQPWAGCPSVRV